jgi:hypothetical protein
MDVGLNDVTIPKSLTDSVNSAFPPHTHADMKYRESPVKSNGGSRKTRKSTKKKNSTKKKKTNSTKKKKTKSTKKKKTKSTKKKKKKNTTRNK